MNFFKTFTFFKKLKKGFRAPPPNCQKMFSWWLSGSYVPILSQNIVFYDIDETLNFFFKKGSMAPKIVGTCFQVLMTFKGPMYPFWVQILNFVMLDDIFETRAPTIVEICFIDDFQGPTYPFKYCILWNLWKFEIFQEKGPGSAKIVETCSIDDFQGPVLCTHFESKI